MKISATGKRRFNPLICTNQATQSRLSWNQLEPHNSNSPRIFWTNLVQQFCPTPDWIFSRWSFISLSFKYFIPEPNVPWKIETCQQKRFNAFLLHLSYTVDIVAGIVLTSNWLLLRFNIETTINCDPKVSEQSGCRAGERSFVAFSSHRIASTRSWAKRAGCQWMSHLRITGSVRLGWPICNLEQDTLSTPENYEIEKIRRDEIVFDVVSSRCLTDDAIV